MKTKEKKKLGKQTQKNFVVFSSKRSQRYASRYGLWYGRWITVSFNSIIQVFHIYFLSERQLFDHRSSSLVSRQCYSHQCINGFFSRLLYLIYKKFELQIRRVEIKLDVQNWVWIPRKAVRSLNLSPKNSGLKSFEAAFNSFFTLWKPYTIFTFLGLFRVLKILGLRT